jgi:hypothetical protein
MDPSGPGQELELQEMTSSPGQAPSWPAHQDIYYYKKKCLSACRFFHFSAISILFV